MQWRATAANRRSASTRLRHRAPPRALMASTFPVPDFLTRCGVGSGNAVRRFDGFLCNIGLVLCGPSKAATPVSATFSRSAGSIRRRSDRTLSQMPNPHCLQVHDSAMMRQEQMPERLT